MFVCNNAKSVSISLKIISASYFTPLISLTMTSVALLTTCEAVTTIPSVEIITPEPSGAVPGGAPNPGFSYPGQVGRTDTTEGEAFSHVLVKSA